MTLHSHIPHISKLSSRQALSEFIYKIYKIYKIIYKILVKNTWKLCIKFYIKVLYWHSGPLNMFEVENSG